MALPKIAQPTFEIKLPSTGKPIKFRPFLVKEEKILLVAKESDDVNDIYRAVKQVVQNCVISPEDFDVEYIATFDLDYLFIRLRATSVDNKIEFQVKDSDDGITYDLDLDLNEVEVQFPKEKVDNKIMITKDMGFVMRYPTTNVSEAMFNKKSVVEMNMEMIRNSVVSIFAGEDIYPWNEASEEEQDEFIESIPTPVYSKIQDFFLAAPKIEHVVKYKNSKGDEKVVIFKTLDDFFALA